MVTASPSVTLTLNSLERIFIPSIQKTKAQHLWIQTVVRIWWAEQLPLKVILKTLQKTRTPPNTGARGQSQQQLRMHCVLEASWSKRAAALGMQPLPRPSRKLRGRTCLRWRRVSATQWALHVGFQAAQTGPCRASGDEINLNQSDGI